MQAASTDTTTKSHPTIAHFVKTFGWAGEAPSGTWVDPATMDYQAIGDNYDLLSVGSHTMNKQTSLSGEKQVAKLRGVFYDDTTKDKSYSAMAEWVLGRGGYGLPDLRAVEFLCSNEGALLILNPFLVRDIESYLKRLGMTSAKLIFPGSTIQSNVGRTNFPFLFYSAILHRIDKNCNGHHVLDKFSWGDVLLLIDKG